MTRLPKELRRECDAVVSPVDDIDGDCSVVINEGGLVIARGLSFERSEEIALDIQRVTRRLAAKAYRAGVLAGRAEMLAARITVRK